MRLAVLAGVAASGLAGPAGADGGVPAKPKLIATGKSPVAVLLRAWYREGEAAGNVGDFYDNRDSGHSLLDTRLLPQLDRVKYTEQMKRQKLHIGAQVHFFFPHVTIGNSSTAANDISWGSNTRRCQMSPAAMRILHRQYRGSHLYVYPEHRDHDAGHNGLGGYGDLFPANMPYVIISQGSSGSDRPFVEAVAYTLAAFRPEVKKKLITTGLLMPTVQMIFRASSRNVRDPKDYLTGKAHPTAFAAENIDKLKMVKLAHAIQLDSLPPAIRLSVVEEDLAEHGRDYFQPGQSEKLFDTPASIVRIWRTVKGRRRMVVRAAGADVNNRTLSYHWTVLRGDAGRISIKPLNDNASVVEIVLDYHPRMPIRPGAELQSNRVDIGAFVHNGVHYSAPAFVCFYSLDSEARTYDARGRIVEIDYAAGDVAVGYPSRKLKPIDDRYTITNWPDLLELIAAGPGPKNFATEIIRNRLSEDEIAVIGETADKLRLAAARQASLKEAMTTAQADQKIAQAEIDATKKKNALDDADANTHLRELRLTLTRAERHARNTRSALARIRKNSRRILTNPRRRLAGGSSVKNCVENILREIVSNPALYIENAASIDEAVRNASPQAKQRFSIARNALLADDILAVDEPGRYRLMPMLPGGAPPADRLSNHQRSRLKQFNAAILQEVLYPGLLKLPFRRNYVSAILSTPKNWRDVYRYDPAGRLIGWTRHSPSGATEFTYDGAEILKKDSLDRPVEARTVRYVIEKNSRGLPRLLKQLPGDETILYEYESDADLIGKPRRKPK